MCHNAAYDDCLHRYGQTARWIGNWDVDEFVFPCGGGDSSGASPRPPALRGPSSSVTSPRLPALREPSSRVPSRVPASREPEPASVLEASVLEVASAHAAAHGSFNLQCLTFGPRTGAGAGAGRLRTRLWRAPDKLLFNESTKCTASSSFMCVGALEKRLSAARYLSRMGLHHHALTSDAPPPMTRQQTRAAGICCHHYRFADLSHVQRKAAINHDPVISAQLAAGMFAPGNWYESVYDDRILAHLDASTGATGATDSMVSVHAGRAADVHAGRAAAPHSATHELRTKEERGKLWTFPAKTRLDKSLPARLMPRHTPGSTGGNRSTQHNYSHLHAHQQHRIHAEHTSVGWTLDVRRHVH